MHHHLNVSINLFPQGLLFIKFLSCSLGNDQIIDIWKEDSIFWLMSCNRIVQPFFFVIYRHREARQLVAMASRLCSVCRSGRGVYRKHGVK